MWEFITHPSNLMFGLAFCLMFLFAILELILLLLSGGSQGLIDQLSPYPILATEPVKTTQGVFAQGVDWLYLGRIPLFVWLIIFLSTYALTGFILQSIFHYFTTDFFNGWVIALACLFLNIPFVRCSSMLIATILPKAETMAMYSEVLIGRTAVIILGEAKINSPAQAKVQDQFGQTHYVLVEPETDEAFIQGQTVVLTQKTNIGFQATMLEFEGGSHLT